MAMWMWKDIQDGKEIRTALGTGQPARTTHETTNDKINQETEIRNYWRRYYTNEIHRTYVKERNHRIILYIGIVAFIAGIIVYYI